LSIVILISANAEWDAVIRLFPGDERHFSPYGEWFIHIYAKPSNSDLDLNMTDRPENVVFFHGGWGKIAAAGSTQFVIDNWSPELLINLGTCGGFEGLIERNEIVLVERTIVYDIIEQMGDYAEHIAHYTTVIDLSWLGEHPIPVRRMLLVSADRDLLVAEIGELHEKFGAIAGDWESGAIAWVAERNQTPILILRVVTDLVGPGGGEAYGKPELFAARTAAAMQRLIEALPVWLEAARKSSKDNF
jgi:adenosylhomocysteine nucleosidase